MSNKETCPVASGIPVYCAHNKIVDITTLQPHPKNPNKHGDKQIALLAKIIKDQGWRNPIVVSLRSGYIIKGHGRLQSAKLLNVEKVPVDYQPYENEAKEYADMIADNRIAELAQADRKMIKDIIQEIDTGEIDIEITGFTNVEIENMMTDVIEPDEPEKKEKKDDSDYKIEIDFENEEAQNMAIEELSGLGYKCRKVIKSDL